MAQNIYTNKMVSFLKLQEKKRTALTEFIIRVVVINTYSAFHADRNITVGGNGGHSIPNKLHLQKKTAHKK